ncbi:DMT family transporter [Amycolatopsis nigrescens]|uniref:DMT family transporter n=1 Tax=Amycolatopsis nigrescens TaxID=381445 RepID=UPI00047765B9|nr:DMT family transporter [Amycolatopsis nigrescens]
MKAAGFGIPAQFALLSLAWGSSFLFIKVGLTGLSPAQVVWARMVLGALTLAVVVVVRRRPLPRGRVIWGHLAVVALLLCVVPFLLFAWAEQHISSGLASIFNATTPLLTMIAGAVALRGERLTRAKVLGLLLGFAGVLTIVGVWRGLGAGGDLTAQLACLGATTSYGVAFGYLRRFVSPHGFDAPAHAFVQVLIGAAVLVALTPTLAGAPVHLTGPVVWSMVALGVLSTGLAYVWNNNIVAAWGAANAAAVTYLTPVVGVLLGVLLLGEPLSWHQPAGALLVIAGILVAHGRLRPAARTPARSGAEP